MMNRQRMAFVSGVSRETEQDTTINLVRRATCSFGHGDQAGLGALHDLNQPLAAIVTNAEAALRWLAADTPDLGMARKSLERVVGNGRRAADTIDTARRSLGPGAAPELDEGETVVFSWIVCPSKAVRDAGTRKPWPIRACKAPEPVLFSMARMIYGGFQPMVEA